MVVVINKTSILFRSACLLSRLILAYLSIQKPKIISYFYILLLSYWIFGNPTNTKGFFGNPVWWKNLRFYHGILYILFIYSVYFNYKNSHYFLFFDCLIAFYVLFLCYALQC